MSVEVWIAAALPGEPLRYEANKKAWALGDRALSAGDRIELLTEGATRRCPTCDGAGWPEAETRVVPLAPVGSGRRAPAATFYSCSACDARGYLFLPVWLAIRFDAGTQPGEADASGRASLEPVAILRPRLPGIAERVGLVVRTRDPVRCRWPVAP